MGSRLQNRNLLLSCPLASRLLTGQYEKEDEKSSKHAPTYLRGIKIDITCLYDVAHNSDFSDENNQNLSMMRLRARDPLADWPQAEKIMLDASQAAAMRHILRCPVALVQGPPGTGKSFLGVKAVQLIHNALAAKYKQKAGPVLLVCLTNHALDQFLGDLLSAFAIADAHGADAQMFSEKRRRKVLRFGGQSKSEDPALLGCAAHNFLEFTKNEKSERAFLQDRLEKLMRQARVLQTKYLTFSKSSEICLQKLVTLLSLCPREAVLQNLVKQIYERDFSLVERGLFSYHPLRFLAAVASHWFAGSSLDQAVADLQNVFCLEREATIDDCSFEPREVDAAYNIYPQTSEKTKCSKKREISEDVKKSARVSDEREQAAAADFGKEFQLLTLDDDQDPHRNDDFQGFGNELFDAEISRFFETDPAYQQKAAAQAKISQIDKKIAVAKRNADDASKQNRNSQAKTFLDDAQKLSENRQNLARELPGLIEKAQKDLISTVLDAGFSELVGLAEKVEILVNSSSENVEIFAEKVESSSSKPKKSFAFDDAWSSDDDENFKNNKKRHAQVAAEFSWSETDSDDGSNLSEKNTDAKISSITLLQQLTALRSNPAPELSWASSPGQRKIFLRQRLSAAAAPSILRIMETAEETSRVLSQMRKVSQLRACGDAAVVGMTSTFAALNRDLLQRLAARVVLVEEAGELLECQLMACLSSPRLEHVVQIGDHQQLRPKVTNHRLALRNHFDVSLFERLAIKRGAALQSLSVQLRMHPDISALVRIFYPQITDGARKPFFDVPGAASRVFWLSHGFREDQWGTGNSDFDKNSGGSKSNTQEAFLALRLAAHLLRSATAAGISSDSFVFPENITILVPYQGQKRVVCSLLDAVGGKSKSSKSYTNMVNNLKKILSKEEISALSMVKIATIDDYQGDENEIIILSLVRSNLAGRLGF